MNKLIYFSGFLFAALNSCAQTTTPTNAVNSPDPEFVPIKILEQSKKHDSGLKPELVHVLQIADKAQVHKIAWKDITWPPKGRSYTEARYNGQYDVVPLGYVRYIALAYARSHARLLNKDVVGELLGAVNTGAEKRDVLSIYSSALRTSNIPVKTASDRLLATYGLLVAKGKLESDGRFYKGQDANRPGNGTADRAEAGAFQSSYDIVNTHASIKKGLTVLIAEYSKSPVHGHLYTAASGTPNGHERHLGTLFYGEGDGRRFQELSRLCPVFSAESSALAIRYSANNYAAVLTQLLQIEQKCFSMLREVRNYVEACDDRSVFLVDD